MRSNCYACRTYFTGCCEGVHPKKDLRWAKHKNGSFWWGRAARKALGVWVRICRYCCVALSEN